MNRKLIKNAKIVDVLAGKVLSDSAILIEDGIIKEVGGNLSAEGAEVLDLGGATVLPGLFNCHVHITMEPVADPSGLVESDAKMTLNAVKHFDEYLKTGVTFIRDVGSPNFIDIELRNAIRAGLIKGPDMQVSGKCVCMTGGHGWSMGRQADGVEDCRKAAREQLRAGADWIKIMATGGVMTKGVEPGSPQLNEDEMRVIVEEAHKAGAKTATHAQGTTGIKNALRAGLDSIEHGCFLDQEAIDLMKKTGAWLVPTLCAPHYILKYGVENGVSEDAVRKCKIVIDSHYRSFREAYAAGIPCAVGTDSGTPFNSHSGTANEMILMVGEGLSPMEAITLGTINSAKMLRVEESLGSITPGKKAHLAVFGKNPIDDIENLHDCIMTIKNGEVLYQK